MDIAAFIRRAGAKALRVAGYRAVPRDRDALSLRKWLAAQNIASIVDVGASKGSTVEEWLASFPAAQVYGIEPLPASFAELKKLELRFRDRFVALNFAASDADGETVFNLHKDHPTSSSILGRTVRSAEVLPFTANQELVHVRTQRLDSVFGDAGLQLPKPLLVKLDVQGYERQILAGAANVLRVTDFLLTEITLAPLYEHQTEFDGLQTAMASAGFCLMGFVEQFHLSDGLPVYADVLYVKRDRYKGLWQC